MIALRRRPQLSAAELAELHAVQTRAEIERARQLDALQRERAAADRAALAERQRAAERAERKRRRAAAKARARWVRRLRRWAATARTVAPLLMANTATVGGQAVYAYAQTPEAWPTVVRVICAAVYALAAETIALYVGWHAHDALLQGAHATAARLRRASYLIAAVFAAINYSHFAVPALAPTAFAVALGTLSLLSPWLWGLHTRRQQNVRLLAEGLVDEGGAEFSAERRRAFPVRTWQARRWSIEHNIRDPRQAWEGYNAERAARRAAAPTGRLRTAAAALCGRLPAAEPAQPVAPEPVREPVSLDDPEVLEAARARIEMAEAAERIRGRVGRFALAGRDPARFADLSAGGLWDMVEATDEPAHIRRPACVVPVRATGEPTQTSNHESTRPAQAARRESTRPARATARRTAGAAADESSTDARLSEAYAALRESLGREPSGAELAGAAHVSKATANRWKSNRLSEATAA